jgi:hypothetical protein
MFRGVGYGTRLKKRVVGEVVPKALTSLTADVDLMPRGAGPCVGECKPRGWRQNGMHICCTQMKARKYNKPLLGCCARKFGGCGGPGRTLLLGEVPDRGPDRGRGLKTGGVPEDPWTGCRLVGGVPGRAPPERPTWTGEVRADPCMEPLP